jgi:hypothetical protein
MTLKRRVADALAVWWLPRWVWRLYPRRLKAWLWLNADLDA